MVLVIVKARKNGNLLDVSRFSGLGWWKMGMIEYIREIKRQFRDTYNFKPSRVVDGEPCFDGIPDGEYPMTIDGKMDKVRIIHGTISCCNFK